MKTYDVDGNEVIEYTKKNKLGSKPVWRGELANIVGKPNGQLPTDKYVSLANVPATPVKEPDVKNNEDIETRPIYDVARAVPKTTNYELGEAPTIKINPLAKIDLSNQVQNSGRDFGITMMNAQNYGSALINAANQNFERKNQIAQYKIDQQNYLDNTKLGMENNRNNNANLLAGYREQGQENERINSGNNNRALAFAQLNKTAQEIESSKLKDKLLQEKTPVERKDNPIVNEIIKNEMGNLQSTEGYDPIKRYGEISAGIRQQDEGLKYSKDIATAIKLAKGDKNKINQLLAQLR